MPFHRAALVLVLLAAGSAHAQVAPDGRRIGAGSDTLISFVVQGKDTVRSGTTVDVIERVRLNGRDVIRRVYTGDDRVMGAVLDTLILDARTLRPIRSASQSMMGTGNVDFSGSRITGSWVSPDGEITTIDETLGAAVYAASAYDLVLRAVPLQQDWHDTVHTYLPSSQEIVAMPATVVGRELVADVECWRVDAKFQAMDVTFWVHPENRSLCQQLIWSPDDAVGFLYRTPATLRAVQRVASPAGPDDATKLPLARRLLEVSGSAEAYLMALRTSADLLRDSDPSVPAVFYDSLVARAEREVDELLERLIPVYLEAYSADELRDLVAFYESPLGRTLVARQPLLQQRAAKIGEEWGMELGLAVGAAFARQGSRDP